ncbi:MAG: VTT domain-containing protein [Planctomycetaceae bacterium]
MEAVIVDSMKTLFTQLRIPLLIVVLLAIIALVASRYASLDWLVENDRWLRNTIRAKPVTTGVIAFFIYLLLSLFPGFAGKSIVLGWLFGLVTGVVIVNLALVSAALVAFLLCRHYLKDAVEARFGFYLRPIQQRMDHDGAMYLLTLRLAHMPFSWMNYAAGAGTHVPFRTFWWTTQIGVLPGNLVFVYAGTRLPTLQELIHAGPLHLLDGPMIAALAGTMFLPWLARKAMRRISRSDGTAQQLPKQQNEPPAVENAGRSHAANPVSDDVDNGRSNDGT